MLWRVQWSVPQLSTTMSLTALVLFACLIQALTLTDAQQNIQEFESKASAIVQQAKSQIVILANQLLTNASLIAQSAEGNASLLLANLYNDINKGIADAQLKVTQIGNSFQANFSKRAEEVMGKAADIYTKVQHEIRNSTNKVEETIGRLLGNTEAEINKALVMTKAKAVAPSVAPAGSSQTKPVETTAANTTAA